jgi:hypothetical protein
MPIRHSQGTRRDQACGGRADLPCQAAAAPSVRWLTSECRAADPPGEVDRWVDATGQAVDPSLDDGFPTRRLGFGCNFYAAARQRRP